MRNNLSDFGIKSAGWEWDKQSKGIWWFVLEKNKLPQMVEHPGPPIKMKDAVTQFKKKHKNTTTKKGKIFAKVKRIATTPEKCIEYYSSKPYVKSRVKQVKK